MKRQFLQIENIRAKASEKKPFHSFCSILVSASTRVHKYATLAETQEHRKSSALFNMRNQSITQEREW